MKHYRYYSLFMVIVMLGVTIGSRVQSQIVPAAPPANDNRANAQVISLPYVGVTNNVSEATNEVGEPLHQCRAGAPGTGEGSVWFKFTVTSSGKITVDTTGSQYLGDEDTLLSIYDFGTMTSVACNDDMPNDTYSLISNAQIPAGTYLIQVSAFDVFSMEDSGNFLNLSVSFLADPPTATPTPIPSSTPTNTPIPPTNTATNTPLPTNTPGGPTDTPTDTPLPPTNTATDTPVSSNTPGGSTDTPTLLPTDTPIPPTDTPTVQPTDTPGTGTEVLLNNGMELDNNADKLPDSWTVKNLTGDKRKCNDATKTVSHNGQCAFMFKGSTTEASKLIQNVDLGLFPIVSGDVLVFSVYFKGSNAALNAKVMLKITYSDSTPAQKANQKVTAAADYTEYIGTLTTQSNAISTVRLQINHRSAAGKLYVDDASIRQNP